jgi:hypothetical protein
VTTPTAAAPATSRTATGRRRSASPRDASTLADRTCTIRELASGATGVGPSAEALAAAVAVVQTILETREEAD